MQVQNFSVVKLILFLCVTISVTGIRSAEIESLLAPAILYPGETYDITIRYQADEDGSILLMLKDAQDNLHGSASVDIQAGASSDLALSITAPANIPVAAGYKWVAELHNVPSNLSTGSKIYISREIKAGMADGRLQIQFEKQIPDRVEILSLKGKVLKDWKGNIPSSLFWKPRGFKGLVLIRSYFKNDVVVQKVSLGVTTND